jgi:hypothetical protein
MSRGGLGALNGAPGEAVMLGVGWWGVWGWLIRSTADQGSMAVTLESESSLVASPGSPHRYRSAS